MNRFVSCIAFVLCYTISFSQQLAPTPPMGWMSWNYLADKVNEQELKEMADAMVANGMVKAGYRYIFIDDCWQGGRNNKNQMIPDPIKFPSGMKALAKYMHDRGLKLGIYSDAAPLTCAGFTASLGFEELDAATFASWDIDYLKYDYCGAPVDSNTAKIRYKKMADALRKSGRDIVFGICEWGDRQPWFWAANAGGQLWRTTADIRDKWKKKDSEKWGSGIIDVLDINARLDAFAGPGYWNDPDMLIVGLYGKKGPSGDGGGIGCTDREYQSQFSLWAMMAAPLYASCDVRNMNQATKNILLNEEIIAINQDRLGKQATRVLDGPIVNVFLKPLSNGDYALAILNRSDSSQIVHYPLSAWGLKDKYNIKDLWQHRSIGMGKTIDTRMEPHETKVFRLSALP